jgi:hypothetical protein
MPTRMNGSASAPWRRSHRRLQGRSRLISPRSVIVDPVSLVFQGEQCLSLSRVPAEHFVTWVTLAQINRVAFNCPLRIGAERMVDKQAPSAVRPFDAPPCRHNALRSDSHRAHVYALSCGFRSDANGLCVRVTQLLVSVIQRPERRVYRSGTVGRSRSIPGDHREGQPSGRLTSSSTPVAVSKPRRPWYTGPVPSCHDCDWHYFGRPGFCGGRYNGGSSGLCLDADADRADLESRLIKLLLEDRARVSVCQQRRLMAQSGRSPEGRSQQSASNGPQVLKPYQVWQQRAWDRTRHRFALRTDPARLAVPRLRGSAA